MAALTLPRSEGALQAAGRARQEDVARLKWIVAGVSSARGTVERLITRLAAIAQGWRRQLKGFKDILAWLDSDTMLAGVRPRERSAETVARRWIVAFRPNKGNGVLASYGAIALAIGREFKLSLVIGNTRRKSGVVASLVGLHIPQLEANDDSCLRRAIQQHLATDRIFHQAVATAAAAREEHEGDDKQGY